MKAIQIQYPGNVAVVDVEKPTLKAGEVLLKLGYGVSAALTSIPIVAATLW